MIQVHMHLICTWCCLYWNFARAHASEDSVDMKAFLHITGGEGLRLLAYILTTGIFQTRLKNSTKKVWHKYVAPCVLIDVFTMIIVICDP